MRFLKNLLARLFESPEEAQRRADEAYLSRATDHADLEARQRQLSLRRRARNQLTGCY